MSRLSKKPIQVPQGVTIESRDGAICVEGPKGTISIPNPAKIRIALDGQGVMISKGEGFETLTESVGTMWSLVKNATIGVSDGFSKVLEIEGVGYRASLEGKTLVLALGFSHPIRFDSPDGIAITAEKNVITISGVNKETVGQVAAKIRGYKKPEPYKGKGIRYAGEIIRRKVGKKAATAGA
ncbi:MAG: 50S ribosomal protein L6 [Patescibacteria group bacterium]